MTDESQSRRFQEIALPHLDAAYNLARWIARSDTDAQDIVQEAFLRAFKSFGGFRGTSARPWLLAIVRNTCYTWLRQHRGPRLEVPYDDAAGSDEAAEPYPVDGDANPEALLAASEERRTFDAALDSLPAEFREAVILRDVEDLSYKEIAAVAAIPIGTVMSRLARGRRMLFAALTRMREGGSHGM
ncbi:MAG TPA: sigma-70 family RNA polymerase sigma factor [Casimicrobiaceae bacterium]|nr:sigma-70 family RNA polymerase sigma factor [Casimicrobiaceae bacterium]